MALREEIDQAISAHSLWKQRLKSAIQTGQADISVENTARDDFCPFGQWLHGPTIAEEAKVMAGYQEVRLLHARFHRQAADILDLALRGKREEAAAQIGITAEYCRLSAQLVQAMLKWQKDAMGRF